MAVIVLVGLIDGGARAAQRYKLCSRAAACHRRALSIRLRAFGEEHAKTAEVYLATAAFCAWRGQRAQADRLQRRGLAVLYAVLPPHHPDVAAALVALLGGAQPLSRLKLLADHLRRLGEAGEGADGAAAARRQRWVAEYAVALLGARNPRGALAACEAELTRCEVELGAEHDATLKAAAAVACLLRDGGRPKQRRLEEVMAKVPALREAPALTLDEALPAPLARSVAGGACEVGA